MRRWLLIGALVALPGCAALQRGAENAGAVAPGAINKFLDSPSMSGLVELVGALGIAFVGGLSGHEIGKHRERKRSRRKVAEAQKAAAGGAA